jgi:hypothetical protein
MCQVLKKVDKEVVKRFSGIGIFLSTIRTESIFNHIPAIEAGFVGSDFAF